MAILKSYLSCNIETSIFVTFKVKQFVANFKPLFLIHPPSSIIQMAKAIGDKYSPIQVGITFLLFIPERFVG
jgi:hypothetical protein